MISSSSQEHQFNSRQNCRFHHSFSTQCHKFKSLWFIWRPLLYRISSAFSKHASTIVLLPDANACRISAPVSTQSSFKNQYSFGLPLRELPSCRLLLKKTQIIFHNNVHVSILQYSFTVSIIKMIVNKICNDS